MHKIEELEIELLSGKARHNPQRINELLADDFFECGKTGDRFGKKECLVDLPQESPDKKIEYSEMSFHMLADSLGQVRYIATIQNSGESPTQSYRSSLWRKTEDGWQMFYHQGTLIK